MLDNYRLEKILFLDIETVPQHPNYDSLDDTTRGLWDKKARTLARNEELPDELYERAGIYAEFGKIVCISVGAMYLQDGGWKLRLKSFYGEDEKQLLSDFNSMIDKNYADPDSYLCGHNGKEFDFPYIARRSLIHGLRLPRPLDTAGKKPWEVKHLDTMELWKFGDFKAYTQLALLAHVFGIPTPKDDIDGSQVGAVYWEERDIDRIAVYCQKDVLTLAQLVLRWKGLPLLEEADVTIA